MGLGEAGERDIGSTCGKWSIIRHRLSGISVMDFTRGEGGGLGVSEGFGGGGLAALQKK